jgi:hypothetical protein
MSTIKNPVGPQPSRVYWRRRLVVGLGLLAVIVIVALLLARPGQGAPGPTDAGKQTGASTSPTNSADPATPLECDPAVMKVEAVTNKGSYKAAEKPQLSLTVTNTGTTECTFSAGSDVQEYVITSGSETIWSSKDCQSKPVAQVATFAPNVPVSTAPIEWNRTRSSTDTCDSKNLPKVTAGGASYHLGVVLGGVKSAETKQFLLY